MTVDEYAPSPELASAIAAFDAAQKAAEEQRLALRAAVGHELKAYPDITTRQVAGFLTWSEETVRGIAREHDVPLKRPPTVKSIKPQRRAKRS